MANEAAQQTETEVQQSAPEADISESNQTLDMEDISAMLSFDPFDDSASAETQTPEVEAPAQSADAAQQSDEPATQDSQETPTPEVVVSPEAQAMLDENAQLKEQLAQLQQQQAQQQQQTAQQQQQQQQNQDPLAEFIPEYQFNLPDPLLQLLDSEAPEERRQGLQYLLQGVAQSVHRSMLEQTQGMMAAYVPSQLEQYSQHQAQVSDIRNDFYSTYKDLNIPELRPIVSQIASQVMQEQNAQGWSPELRDAIATRVRAILNHGQQQTQQQVQTPAPVEQPPQLMDQGSRGPIQGRTLADDVANTLFG